MYELEKLGEAKYFYDQLLTAPGREQLPYNLSAFLSAARSILQYALEEARTKKEGQQWYDTHITQSGVLSFFKDQRDINIHTKPIKPAQHASVDIKGVVHISSSLHIRHLDKDGNVLSESQAKPERPKPTKSESEPSVKTTVEYRFTDWEGTEDILILCQKYLLELDHIINDGIKKGFITG